VSQRDAIWSDEPDCHGAVVCHALALDLGTVRAELQAASPRVACPSLVVAWIDMPVPPQSSSALAGAVSLLLSQCCKVA
jgi:hypothetical protein